MTRIDLFRAGTACVSLLRTPDGRIMLLVIAIVAGLSIVQMFVWGAP